MSESYPQRNYNMSDGALCMVASNLCNTLTRDLADLTAFGVTAPKIATFKALGDAFEVFTTDSVALANIIGATEEKNTILEDLKEAIRNMALRCQIKWGAKSHQEKSLNITGFNAFRIEEILVVARRVHEQMTLLQPDLVDLGLTQIVLDDYWDLIQSSEDKYNLQLDQIKIRDKMTMDRILKGNELYAEVINFSNIGKRVYAMSNPAYYNDYIIYDSFSAGSLTAPENLSVDVNTMTFSCDPVPNAVTYQFEMAVAGSSEFEVIYSGPDNFFNYTPPASGLRSYRARCHSSAGYSEYSSLMLYNFISVLAQPGYVSVSVINANTGAIAINWEENPEASFYRLYQSKVGIGDPESEYTLVCEYTTGSYSGTVTTGFRYYFKVICGNSEKLSIASDSVLVDLYLIP